jgi:CarD family transcriptional regulator
MTFELGDTVVHPQFGAGEITDIQEIGAFGPSKRYYSIRLLSDVQTTVMVALDKEESVGLRRPIPKSRLSRLWRIFREQPQALPEEHKERHAVIEGKLQEGDLFQIAEAVRDLAWYREEKRPLTKAGERLYETGLGFLASELAGVEGSDVETAQAQITERLEASIGSAIA